MPLDARIRLLNLATTEGQVGDDALAVMVARKSDGKLYRVSWMS
jgi:hypothetical protein